MIRYQTPVSEFIIILLGSTFLCITYKSCAADEFKELDLALKNYDKGLVIFNAAVGGWSRGEGGQKYLETCLRGVEHFLYFF